MNREVFVKEFYLSFSNLKEDTCDACDMFDARIKTESDPQLKADIISDRDYHVALNMSHEMTYLYSFVNIHILQVPWYIANIKPTEIVLNKILMSLY